MKKTLTILFSLITISLFAIGAGVQSGKGDTDREACQDAINHAPCKLKPGDYHCDCTYNGEIWMCSFKYECDPNSINLTKKQ